MTNPSDIIRDGMLLETTLPEDSTKATRERVPQQEAEAGRRRLHDA
ncbi:MAG TPA: hypothetical protein VJV04_06515 [Nitrospiraceae bacterium]|nr:hypothetical protein [Nitrospiraceae bacterium]